MASQYGLILTATKTLVAAISGLTGTNQVVIRKRLAFVKNVDVLFPFVCIVPTVENYADGYMSNRALMDYPVQVAIIEQSALALYDPEPTLLLREQIRQKLMTPTLSGTTSWQLSRYDAQPAFDASGFDATFDLSVQEFVWRASEVRNQ